MDCIDSQSGERLSMEALHCTCGTMEKRRLLERVDKGKDCCRRSGVFLLGSLVRYSWLAILLMLLGNIAQTHQATTPAPPTVTPTLHPGCFVTFRANRSTDEFLMPCEKITFPTASCANLEPLQRVNPTDCSRYFVCTGQLVYDCPCAPGTAVHSSTGQCDREFFANCTCPDGRAPATTTMNPLVGVGGSSTGLIAGLVVGFLVIFILILVIVLLIRRKKQQEAKPMTPSQFGQQTSVGSVEYEDVRDLKRGDETNIYDNPPPYDTAVYDNHGFGDRDAVRPREKNGTITSTASEEGLSEAPEASAPPLPSGHPVSQKIKNPEDEPEYMETV